MKRTKVFLFAILLVPSFFFLFHHDDRINEPALSMSIFAKTSELNKKQEFDDHSLPEVDLDEWDVLQTSRKEHLNRECSRLQSFGKIDTNTNVLDLRLRNILVDQQHKLLYCYIPKVACTQWKRLFLVLTGKVLSETANLENISTTFVHYGNKLTTLDDPQFKQEEVSDMLRTYKKMMIVRHPLERLYSVYKDKFLKNDVESNSFKLFYAKDIMAFARNVRVSEVPINGTGLTFEEYLFYLSNYSSVGTQEQWAPMHQLCHPCHIQYDYISKFETIETDSNKILKKIGAEPNLNFPIRNLNSSTPQQLKKLVRTIPYNVLEMLYKKHQPDWTLFKYDKKKYIQEH